MQMEWDFDGSICVGEVRNWDPDSSSSSVVTLGGHVSLEGWEKLESASAGLKYDSTAY